MHYLGKYVSSPTGFFFVFLVRRRQKLSDNKAVSSSFMPAACARPKEAKINLMDCRYVRSEVEIVRFQTDGHPT